MRERNARKDFHEYFLKLANEKGHPFLNVPSLFISGLFLPPFSAAGLFASLWANEKGHPSLNVLFLFISSLFLPPFPAAGIFPSLGK